MLGWWIWPLEWVNGAPVNLSTDYQRQYLCMLIDSYVRNQDQTLMRVRWSSLGSGNTELLKSLTASECRFSSNAEIDSFKTIMNVSSNPALTLTPGTSSPAASNSRVSFLTSSTLLWPDSCSRWTFAVPSLSKRSKINLNPKKKSVKNTETKENFNSPNPPQAHESLQEKPMAQFVASFHIGQDLYDESFSIDSTSGEFLGECGLGIAESIGVGDPKKVTALEMWLFR